MNSKLLSRVQFSVIPWTVAWQANLSMGFSRQEYWSGLSLPSPGDHPHLGIELGSPALRANFFPSEPPGKPYQGTCSWYVCLILSALPRKSRMVHSGAGPSEFQALHSPWQERRLEGHTTALKCLHSKNYTCHLSSPRPRVPCSTGKFEKSGKPVYIWWEVKWLCQNYRLT